MICLISTSWPLLRVAEKQGIKRSVVNLNQRREPAIHFPLSKVKLWIVVVGATTFAVFGGLSVFIADSIEYRVKGGIGLAFYVVVLMVLGFNLARWQPGIFVTSSGIDWREPFGSRHMISWDELLWAKIYDHREKYATVRSVGLLLRNPERVSPKRRTQERLRRNFAGSGVHLYLQAESVLVPLDTLARTLQFYATNPKARSELVDGTAYGRISNGSFPVTTHTAPSGTTSL